MLLILKQFPARVLVNLTFTLLKVKNYRKQVINNNYKSTIESHISTSSTKQFYQLCLRNIARILVETLTFNSSHSESIVYKDIAELEKKCKEQNGLILLASHYGNWELACIHLPLHTSIPCYGVYKPLKNKVLDKITLELRSKNGLQLIPMNSIVRTIAEHTQHKIPAIYILIADQNPRSIHNVVWSKFLGIMTAFSKGFIKIKQKYHLPMAYMKTSPKKDLFTYDVSFEFPETTLSNTECVKWYSKMVEDQILDQPHYWLWSHDRWKRKYSPQ